MSSQIENQDKKILVVDDDPATIRLVQKALEWEGYPVEVAQSGQEAIEKIKTVHPHLILLDVSMPGLNGLDTLKLLRQRPEYASVIFVSGHNNTEDVIRGLDAGADDYVCKPFNVSELLARVRAQLRIKVLNDNLAKANAKLKELVDIDDLTGLFNMRSLYKKLDYEIDRASRYDRSVCVLMMDMDHFKSVNDNNDHLFGSFVLAEVGKIIRNNMRKIDFAARYGGDEFLIVLTEIDLAGVQSFAERLRAKVAENEFVNDLHRVRLTASLGFAITKPGGSGVDSRTLVRWADRALYDAKESGRNCIKYYVLESKEEPITKQMPHLLRKIK